MNGSLSRTVARQGGASSTCSCCGGSGVLRIEAIEDAELVMVDSA